MRFLYLLLCLLLAATASAQTFKKLPPEGIEIDPDTAQDLRQRVESIKSLSSDVHSTEHLSWMTDVDVLVRAVDLALDQNLFYRPEQTKHAGELLDEAQRRITTIDSAADRTAWMGWSDRGSEQPQMIVGGFRSRIDDSVQPFGVVLPNDFQPDGGPYRLDVWLHGRGDNKTEIPFLVERMTKVGQYSPDKTIVLHPFGRHCNAFKFAGEVDVLEAIEHVSSFLPIDRNRISIRGFSMGGAGCWHMAVHYPDKWFAANPGAGFVDTLVYQGWSEKQPFEIDLTREKLLRWYDVLPWVSNLRNTNVIAYSGEVDKQKQAADRVAQAAEELGISFPYVIGEKMGHKIDPQSAEKISQVMDSWASEETQIPRRRVDLTTYTLRYNKVDWLQIDGLSEHWTRATASGELVGDDTVRIQSDGITHLSLNFHQSGSFDGIDLKVDIDGDRLLVADQSIQEGFFANLIRAEDGWYALETPDRSLRKRPGLQGPIDDAFCDRFLFVLPSRPAAHGVVERWIHHELQYAKNRWRRLMRGDVREVLDTELTEAQIQTNHLICFGDFQSNRFLSEVNSELPLKWSPESIRVGTQQFDPSTHAVAMCFPNPRNPDRYVVVNSGMTFREFSNVSNSRQIAMLPDWAVIDVSQADDSIFPGRVAADGFFDEKWQLGR